MANEVVERIVLNIFFNFFICRWQLKRVYIEEVLIRSFTMGWLLHITCFVLYIVVYILFLVIEIALNITVAVQMYVSKQYIWCVLLFGLFVISSAAVQMLSYHWIDLSSASTGSRVKIIILHSLQLGLLWRYLRLMMGHSNIGVKSDMYKSMLLRIVHIFSCGLPFTIIETYLLVAPDIKSSLHDKGLLMVAAIWSLLACCWSLTTFRKHPEYYTTLTSLFSWPGSMFKYLWRVGELAVRVSVIGLFAGLYGYWILLVLSLHWITMFLLGFIETYVWYAENKGPSPLGGSKYGILRKNLVTSFVHIFCYINVTNNKTRYKFCFYYSIMGLENLTLLILWVMYDDRTTIHAPIATTIGGAYMVALASAVLYYNCFHMKLSQAVCQQPDTIFIQQCINCRLSCCSKHNKQMQRPFPTWQAEITEKLGTPGRDLVPQYMTSAHGNRGEKREHYDNYSSYSGQYPYSCSTCDSTIYEEGIYSDLETTRYTEETEYSDYIWDDYDVQQLRSLSQDQQQNNKPVGNREGTPERSDSGFSASGSSNSKNNRNSGANKIDMVFIKNGKVNMYTTNNVPTDQKQNKHRTFGLPHENTKCHCKTCGSIYPTQMYQLTEKQRPSKSVDVSKTTRKHIGCNKKQTEYRDKKQLYPENKESITVSSENVLSGGYINYGTTLTDEVKLFNIQKIVEEIVVAAMTNGSQLKGVLESSEEDIVI